MPEIGSYVIYGANGICVIKDKRKDKLCRTKNEYYVLEPVDFPGSSIFVPADNEKLVGKMKDILTKDEIMSLVCSVDDGDIEWISDNKLRTETYNDILEKGERREILKLMKCIYSKKKEMQGTSKKLWASDEGILKTARKMIDAEFSLVLGIDSDKIEELFSQAK